MDRRNFHQKFVDSLNQRDWQLAALILVPLACFLLAEVAAVLTPARDFETVCLKSARARTTDRLLGAMLFDVGPAEVTERDTPNKALTVEVTLGANGIPLRTAYHCAPNGDGGVALTRLWTRRV